MGEMKWRVHLMQSGGREVSCSGRDDRLCVCVCVCVNVCVCMCGMIEQVHFPVVQQWQVYS